MCLMYLRLTTKAPEIYEILEDYYNDNRKLRLKDSIGSFSIIYIDEMADKLLVDEVFLGINLPFIKKRMALEEQGQIEPRISILENDENEEEMDE